MGIEKCSPRGRAPNLGRVSKYCGIHHMCDNADRGAPMRIDLLLSQAEECGNGGIEQGMHYRRTNQDRGD